VEGDEIAIVGTIGPFVAGAAKDVETVAVDYHAGVAPQLLLCRPDRMRLLGENT
jgi:hypothetical protein